MAMKILKFSRFQQESVRGQRALLTIKFLDNDSNLYSWAPRWADVESAFLRALNVEAFNKPESEWLNRFANTVRDVSEGISQPIQDARKVSGAFVEFREGKLLIHDGHTAAVTPGFAITYEFLEAWLDVSVEALVIDGIAVYVKDWRTGKEYPPKSTSAGYESELPC